MSDDDVLNFASGGGLCGGGIIGLVLFVYVMVAYVYVNGLDTNTIKDSSYLSMIFWIQGYAIGEIVIVSLSYTIFTLICCCTAITQDGSAIMIGLISYLILLLGSLIYNIIFISNGYPIYTIVHDNCTLVELNNLGKCQLLNTYYTPIIIIMIVILSFYGLFASCLGCFGCCILTAKCCDK